jgi:hypothetical protein
MHPVFSKTFGGLSPAYYFRQFFFGFVIGAVVIYLATRSPHSVPISTVALLVVNTLLYPYARFVYESIMNFILGQNTFYLNAIVLLFFKLLTMALCWSFAIFIAPVGLAYLYLHHSKAESGSNR